MALTGFLAGFNEQRGRDVNYLAQLDAMRRAQAALELDQERTGMQADQAAQEMQFRQAQAEQAAQERDEQQAHQSMQAQRQRLSQMGAESAQLAQQQRQSQGRNALAELLKNGGDPSASELGRAVLPYDPSAGINLLKSGREEMREQALLARTGGTGVQPRQGYRWTQDGNQEYIPGGEADPNVVAQLEYARSSNKGTNKQTAAQDQKVNDAKDVLGLLDMAEPFVDKATHSIVGQGVDWLGKAVGIGTEGAQAGARLSAIEGMLVSKMPKMSGPQSDKDVLLYKQMAGQIGDASVPPEVKRAAMDTIREINERYAGGQQQPQQPRQSQQFNSLPDPRQHNGKIVRDTETGTRWMSNGRDWVRAQ